MCKTEKDYTARAYHMWACINKLEKIVESPCMSLAQMWIAQAIVIKMLGLYGKKFVTCSPNPNDRN